MRRTPAVSIWSSGVAKLYRTTTHNIQCRRLICGILVHVFLNIRCIRVVYSMDIAGRRPESWGTPLCSRVIGDVIVYLDTLGAEIQVGPEP